jgi:CheY-like chemotaxis protein
MKRAAASSTPFNVVVLDGALRGSGTRTFVEAVRRDPELKDCGLVLLLPAGQQDASECCREMDIENCVTKPAKASDLLEAVLTALGAPGTQEKRLDRTAQTASQGPLRILLAEDAPVNQEVAVGLLELQGHEVVVANNGREAVRALARDTFDAVLMDVEMPEMDGLQATAVIREMEKERQTHIPIVAMTAHAVKGFRERCVEAGMDGYIAKPVQPTELFQVLDSIPRNARSTEASDPSPPPPLSLPVLSSPAPASCRA